MSLVAGNVEMLAGLDGLICDLDGVMYRGAEPIDGSPETIERLSPARRARRVLHQQREPNDRRYLREAGLDGRSNRAR